MAATTLQIVDEQVTASWSHARKLVEKVRAGARAWVELGQVIEALRSEFLSKGGRPKNSPHGAASSDNADPGWQAKVREELGISDDTARRWILDAQRYSQMLQLTSGSAAQVDGKKVTADVRKRAQEVVAAIQSDPTIRPARMWAGIWGAEPTTGNQRAKIDHGRNIARALTALQTSLPHWNDLTPEQRLALEHGWGLIRDILPATFK